MGFGNGEFGAVESVVFFGNGIEVDAKRGCDFADGDRDSAGAEVIADFDFASEDRVAEKALDFAFGWGVALLDLGGIFERGVGMFLGRSGGAADAIASGAATDQKDGIAGGGFAAEDLRAWGSGNDRTDLEAFGDIARVVNFGDFTGRESDLVAVGGIPVSCGAADFSLWQFAWQRFRKWRERIARAGDAHGLINIRAAGERIANATAEAGGGAAEGFDLGWVVVSFVFEHHEPLLGGRFGCGRVLDRDRHDDRGGVDFIGLFEVIEFAGGAEFAHAGEGDVHQRDGLAVASEFFARCKVGLPCAVDGTVFIIENDIGDFREECRVAAVVGPIGVEHADFGDAWFAFFLVAKIGLAKCHIGGGHREAELLAKFGRVAGIEAVQNRDIGRSGRLVAIAGSGHGHFV